MIASIPGIDLIRLEYSREAILGVLKIAGRPRFVTLEPPWYLNKRDLSCIPAGSYTCERYTSAKLGLETFKVLNVPGRSGIAFHPGVIPDHTDGCILVGLYYGEANTPSICRSKAAFKKFMDALHGIDAFRLNIA